jgi:hypothetical protein
MFGADAGAVDRADRFAAHPHLLFITKRRDKMLSDRQANQAMQIALEMIQDGAAPQALVHVQFYPSEYEDDGIQGLSTPLPEGTDLSGYLSRYYTLDELARGR